MGEDLWVFYGLPPGPAALPGESVGRKGIGYPIGGFPTPKAFPSGGRCPSAHTGADEGAIWYPTFPCRKKALSRLSPQRGFSIASLGNPVAPSSVTSGDSFPPRGSLRRWYAPATKCFRTQPLLPQNANPNQGTHMGTVLAPPPEQCGTTAKTSEWQRAGHKTGGPGGTAPGPLSPHFSGEMGTPPGRRAPGALRPEAPEEPRPPKGYVAPYRVPARRSWARPFSHEKCAFVPAQTERGRIFAFLLWRPKGAALRR